MTTGGKIEKLAKANGYNIKQLAVSAGVNYSTLYSVIKRNSTFVNKDLIRKIAYVLNVEPKTLLNDSTKIGIDELSDAEVMILNTVNAIASRNSGNDRENCLYLINSFLETNSEFLESIFNKMKKGEKKENV